MNKRFGKYRCLVPQPPISVDAKYVRVRSSGRFLPSTRLVGGDSTNEDGMRGGESPHQGDPKD